MIEEAINAYIKKLTDNKRYSYGVFLVMLLSMSILMVYLYSPLQPGHDFYFHFRRFNSLIEALKNENFYPAYLDYTAIEGYGYFTKAFYPDLILYPFAIIGVYSNVAAAYQIMIGVMTFLCGIFTYYAINAVYKKRFAAFTGAILYTFCFYRLIDVYQRSAIGEALAFTFFPLIFAGLYFIIKGDCKKWYILAIGFILTAFTHVISTVLAATICFVFLIIYNKSLRKEPKRLLYLFPVAICTLLVCAYYFIPFIEQIMSDTFYFQTHKLIGFFDSGFKLNWIIWGLFGGIVQPRQIMTPGTGIILTFAIALRILVNGKSKKIRSADILVMIGLTFILLSTDFLGKLWTIFPLNLLSFIQFPWRLYAFSSLFFAIAGAYYLSLIVKGKKRQLAALGLLCLLTLFMITSDSKLYQTARHGDIYTKDSYTNNYHLGGCEYIPSETPSLEYIHERGSDSISHNISTNILEIKRVRNNFKIDISVKENDKLELPLLYYKGYKAMLNNQLIPVGKSLNGLVEIQTNESGRVEVWYAGTTAQKTSWYISTVSLFLFISYIVVYKRKRKKNEIAE